MQEPRDGYEAVRSTYPPLLNTAQVAELLDLNTPMSTEFGSHYLMMFSQHVAPIRITECTGF